MSDEYISCDKCNYMLSDSGKLKESLKIKDLPVLCGSCREGELKFSAEIEKLKKEKSEAILYLIFKNTTNYKHPIYKKKDEGELTVLYKMLKIGWVKKDLDNFYVDEKMEIKTTIDLVVLKNLLNKESKLSKLSVRLPSSIPWQGNKICKIEESDIDKDIRKGVLIERF